MAGFSEIKNLDALIKDTIGEEVIEQTAKRLVPPGENYGSVIYKVDFKTKNGNSYHAVAKCTPPNKVTQEMFNTQVTFKAEIGWYTSVIPTLKQFQRDKGIQQVADFFQNFYGGRISLDPNSNVVDEDGVILTENLITLGYKNADRHVGFDLKTSKAVLRDLATFHAVPLALRCQNKDLFETKIAPFLPKFREQEFEENNNMFEDIKNGLKEITELEPYLEKAINVLDNNALFDFEAVPKEPWGSVCHNDFWTNNIMVTEGEDPKTIVLDLQTPSYASIAGDVLFFVSLSVHLEVVKIHLYELIQFYYTHFIRNLVELGIETDRFSYEEFKNELSAQAKKQLGHALFIGQFVFLEKGQTHFDSSDENFSKENLTKNTVRFNKVHKDRFTWLIREFANRNWL